MSNLSSVSDDAGGGALDGPLRDDLDATSVIPHTGPGLPALRGFDTDPLVRATREEIPERLGTTELRGYVQEPLRSAKHL